MIVRVQLHAVLCKVYTNSVGYLFLFILTTVFGDTYYVMSVTSPYAFLVAINYHKLSVNFREYCLPLISIEIRLHLRKA